MHPIYKNLGPTPAALRRVASAHTLVMADPVPRIYFVTPLGRPQYQGGAGSCEAHGGSKPLEDEALGRGAVAQVSRRFLYWCARLIDGNAGRDVGTFSGSVAKAIETYGVVSEQECPYRDVDVNLPPKAEVFESGALAKFNAYDFVPQSVMAMKSAIVPTDEYPNGRALSFCMMVSRDFERVTAGDGIARFTGGDLGGHNIHIVGFDDDRGAFLCEGSWEDFGVTHPLAGASKVPDARIYFWIRYEDAESVSCWDPMRLIGRLPVEV